VKKLILVLTLSVFTMSAFAQFDASKYKNPQTAMICNTLIKSIESKGDYPNSKLIDSSPLTGDMLFCKVRSKISTGFGIDKNIDYRINYNKKDESYEIKLV
jgi:hypothetical protein